MEPIPDAAEFFRRSAGVWRSQRTSHHLLHRRAETGASLIEVQTLDPGDARLEAIARLHGQDAARLSGGCHVRWTASMAWDRAGEDHEGETLFALVPTQPGGREGLLLRDRGYAETSPVAGRFEMDDEDGLVLITSYETMESRERFWFLCQDVRLRASTVEGLSNTASLCIETRMEVALPDRVDRPELQPSGSALGW
ncbi:MAG: phycobiliprotein lyase [Aphanocapsa feldmannii 277cV]|uniref:Chromophore lyase CpcS/CpeS n=2 Tax=Aphanocapsa feldmannii TaxID=192050 RepID=A0A524RMI1_9CHRO|nr:MAG: phycobiliprotein lyase [Aphanocapsa feldmannii 277cV]TGH20692.1 MAG: phycobiliprotein lyase [Aphanocapsa feldmannii 277cI]